MRQALRARVEGLLARRPGGAPPAAPDRGTDARVPGGARWGKAQPTGAAWRRPGAVAETRADPARRTTAPQPPSPSSNLPPPSPTPPALPTPPSSPSPEHPRSDGAGAAALRATPAEGPVRKPTEHRETLALPSAADGGLATPLQPLLAAWPAEPVSPVPSGLASAADRPVRRRCGRRGRGAGAAASPAAPALTGPPPPPPRADAPYASMHAAAVAAASVTLLLTRRGSNLGAADCSRAPAGAASPATRSREPPSRLPRALAVACLCTSLVSPARPAALRMRAARVTTRHRPVSPPPSSGRAKRRRPRGPPCTETAATTAASTGAPDGDSRTLRRQPPPRGSPGPYRPGAAARVCSGGGERARPPPSPATPGPYLPGAAGRVSDEGLQE